MATLKNWIAAFRPRTLFLAVGTVVLGSGLAIHEGSFSTTTFLLAFLLAVAIQILANLANDLGDFEKGTDTTGQRQGPTRTVQGGSISPREMKTAIAIFSILCAITGLLLVLDVITYISLSSAILLIVIGGACILAALFYTLGNHAYGYKGWGDLLAFLFFGPVPVIGTYFLHTHSFDFQPVLPAIGMGIISTMILNVNNMRDIDNDRVSGKFTVAVRLGLDKAKTYHAVMTVICFFCFIGYNRLYEPSPWYRYLYLLVFLLLFNILSQLYRKSGQALDPYLKKTSISGSLLALFFAICINI